MCGVTFKAARLMLYAPTIDALMSSVMINRIFGWGGNTTDDCEVAFALCVSSEAVDAAVALMVGAAGTEGGWGSFRVATERPETPGSRGWGIVAFVSSVAFKTAGELVAGAEGKWDSS